MEGFEPPRALRRLADFESAPFSHLGTSPETWLLYQRRREKSRIFLFIGILFRQFQYILKFAADRGVIRTSVRKEALAAIFCPILYVSIISAAFVTQSIQRTVTEKTVEILWLGSFMAGKKLTFPVLKEIVMGHGNLLALQLCSVL